MGYKSWPKRLSDSYRRDLRTFYRYSIPLNSKVLEISDRPIWSNGNSKMSKLISPKDLVKKNFKDKYDFIVISDALGTVYDVQEIFHYLKNFATSDTRIIFNYHNYLWQPVLDMAEKIGLKKPTPKANWLNELDIFNLLTLEDLEIVKRNKRYLMPVEVPFLTLFVNKFLVQLPLISSFAITNVVTARLKPAPLPKQRQSVSIVVPARNESGNIRNAVSGLGKYLTKDDELIFVEGHSKDDTWQEILKLKNSNKKIPIKAYRQTGIGKADAVRLGFSRSSKQWLLIWDADLTVSPEELPKFLSAMSQNKGEYINGSRLVYPMEKQAMQFLNILGNHFFSAAFSWLLDQRIKDTLCGSKAISKENYRKLERNRKYFGDFDPFGDFDLIFGAAKLNLKFIEIPIRYRARTYGSTNISRFTHGWLLIKMLFFAMGKIKFI